MNYMLSLFINLFKLLANQSVTLMVLLSIIMIAISFLYYYVFFKMKNNKYIEHYLLKEQMKKTEFILNEIENDIKNFYMDLSKKLNSEKDLIDKEVIRFILFNKFINFRTKSLIREAFDENHLTTKKDIEFEVYIKERTKSITTQIFILFDKWYISGGRPTKLEFIETFSETELNSLTATIMQILREGKIISSQFEDKKYLKKYFKKL